MISQRIIDICSSDLDWANPGGQPTAAGMYLVATATFTGLPANNSDFGLKQATIHLGCGQSKPSDFEVFFPRDATNHPSGQVGSPNWFYYWGQTAANTATTTMRYSTNTVSGRSEYDYSIRTIFLADSAADKQIAEWGSPEGIDCYAWVVAPENKHHLQLTAFWPVFWDCLLDNDEGVGDWLPDQIEATFMSGHPYNNQLIATYPDEFRYSTDPLLNDVEDICMRNQNSPNDLDVLWQNGAENANDWADPGKNNKNAK